jgi:hypothetical protein
MAHTQVRSSIRPYPPADTEREQRIRERAYLLWEADGRPHGRDVEYWERACELTGVAESAGSGVLPDPGTVPGRPRQGGVTKAKVKADPGKVPDRPVNQGAAKTSPPSRRTARAKSQKPA